MRCIGGQSISTGILFVLLSAILDNEPKISYHPKEKWLSCVGMTLVSESLQFRAVTLKQKRACGSHASTVNHRML